MGQEMFLLVTNMQLYKHLKATYHTERKYPIQQNTYLSFYTNYGYTKQARVSVCPFVCVYMCVRVCTRVYVCTRVCTCVYVCGSCVLECICDV